MKNKGCVYQVWGSEKSLGLMMEGGYACPRLVCYVALLQQTNLFCCCRWYGGYRTSEEDGINIAVRLFMCTVFGIIYRICTRPYAVKLHLRSHKYNTRLKKGEGSVSTSRQHSLQVEPESGVSGVSLRRRMPECMAGSHDVERPCRFGKCVFRLGALFFLHT